MDETKGKGGEKNDKDREEEGERQSHTITRLS